jgi:hypothetical protein
MAVLDAGCSAFQRCRAAMMRMRSSAMAASSGGRATNSSAVTASRSWPAITASCTHGAQASITATRSLPTTTQVPVASLKFSPSRPSKAMPCAGSCSLTKRPASPVRRKPSSSSAGGSMPPPGVHVPGVTLGPRTRSSWRPSQAASFTSTPGAGSPMIAGVAVGKYALVDSGAVSVEPHAEAKNTGRPSRRASASSRSRVAGGSAAAA